MGKRKSTIDSGGRAQAHRILVVDDDPLVVRQLQDLYRQHGYQVDTGTGAYDALELLKRRHYDLAVFDLKVPGTDGFELTKQVRSRWPQVAVIIVTGYRSIQGAVTAVRNGASDYVTKPIERDEILLATEKALADPRRLPVSFTGSNG